MRERKSILNNIDLLTVFLYLVMVCFGWLNIYAAEYDESFSSIFDMNQRYGKQFIWIMAALVLAFIVLTIDSKFYATFAYLFYGITILSLLAVLAVGTTISGSKSWFQIGSFAIQPAEFAKFATALALAKFLSGLNIKLSHRKTIFQACIIIGLPAALIFLQHDTGSALVYAAFVFVLFREGLSAKVLLFGTAAIVLFILTLLFNKFFVIGGLFVLMATIQLMVKTSKQSLFSLLIIFIIGASFIYSIDYAMEHVFKPHQKVRINNLVGKDLDIKGAYYNVHQSKIAIGSGGFSGKGFLNGTQTKFNFVPEQSTDFIYCTVGEEWGFLGSSFVIIMFLVFLSRLLKLAERQRSAFGRIYGYGVVSILFFHFAVNIGMTIGIAPVIGIPLPFFSYGGSSLWAFTILLFIFIRLDASRLEVL